MWRYLIANQDPRAAAPFDTDYGTKRAEFVDVYAGPLSTVYGEVFWQGLPAAPLPPVSPPLCVVETQHERPAEKEPAHDDQGKEFAVGCLFFAKEKRGKPSPGRPTA